MALADNRDLRRKAQPFILMHELWDILELGVAAGRQADEMRWTLEGNLLTGSVRTFWGMSEEQTREAWAAWVKVIEGHPIEAVDCDEGRIHLRAAREAYGLRLIQVVIEADVPLRSQAALRGLV